MSECTSDEKATLSDDISASFLSTMPKSLHSKKKKSKLSKAIPDPVLLGTEETQKPSIKADMSKYVPAKNVSSDLRSNSDLSDSFTLEPSPSSTSNSEVLDRDVSDVKLPYENAIEIPNLRLDSTQTISLDASVENVELGKGVQQSEHATSEVLEMQLPKQAGHQFTVLSPDADEILDSSEVHIYTSGTEFFSGLPLKEADILPNVSSSVPLEKLGNDSEAVTLDEAQASVSFSACNDEVPISRKDESKRKKQKSKSTKNKSETSEKAASSENKHMKATGHAMDTTEVLDKKQNAPKRSKKTTVAGKLSSKNNNPIQNKGEKQSNVEEIASQLDAVLTLSELQPFSSVEKDINDDDTMEDSDGNVEILHVIPIEPELSAQEEPVDCVEPTKGVQHSVTGNLDILELDSQTIEIEFQEQDGIDSVSVHKGDDLVNPSSELLNEDLLDIKFSDKVEQIPYSNDAHSSMSTEFRIPSPNLVLKCENDELEKLELNHEEIMIVKSVTVTQNTEFNANESTPLTENAKSDQFEGHFAQQGSLLGNLQQQQIQNSNASVDGVLEFCSGDALDPSAQLKLSDFRSENWQFTDDELLDIQFTDKVEHTPYSTYVHSGMSTEFTIGSPNPVLKCENDELEKLELDRDEVMITKFTSPNTECNVNESTENAKSDQFDGWFAEQRPLSGSLQQQTIQNSDASDLWQFTDDTGNEQTEIGLCQPSVNLVHTAETTPTSSLVDKCQEIEDPISVVETQKSVGIEENKTIMPNSNVVVVPDTLEPNIEIQNSIQSADKDKHSLDNSSLCTTSKERITESPTSINDFQVSEQGLDDDHLLEEKCHLTDEEMGVSVTEGITLERNSETSHPVSGDSDLIPDTKTVPNFDLGSSFDKCSSAIIPSEVSQEYPLEFEDEPSNELQGNLLILKEMDIYLGKIEVLVALPLSAFFTAHSLEWHLYELQDVGSELSEKEQILATMKASSSDIVPELDMLLGRFTNIRQCLQQKESNGHDIILPLLVQKEVEIEQHLQEAQLKAPSEKKLSMLQEQAQILEELKRSNTAQIELLSTLQVLAHNSRTHVADVPAVHSSEMILLQQMTDLTHCVSHQSNSHVQDVPIWLVPHASIIPAPTLHQLSDLSHRLNEEMTKLFVIVTNRGTRSEMAQQYITVVQTVVHWLQIIEYETVQVQWTTDHHSIQQYEIMKSQLDQVQKQMDEMSQLSQEIVPGLPVEVGQQMVQSLESLQNRVESISDLIQLAHRATLHENHQAINISEEIQKLDSDIEQDILEEVSAGSHVSASIDDYLSNLENTSFDNHQNQLAKIKRNQLKLQMQRPDSSLADLTNLEKKLHARKVQLEKSRKRDFHQQRRLLNHISRLGTQMTELGIMGDESLNYKAAVNSVEELQQLTEHQREISDRLHLKLAHTKALIAKLDQPLISDITSRYSEEIAATEKRVTQMSEKIVQQEHCLLEWTQLQRLLEANTHWLQNKRDSLIPQDDVSHLNLLEMISNYKCHQTDIENQLPQIVHIRNLHLSIQNVIQCPLLMREVSLQNTHWHNICRQITQDLQKMQSFWNQWQAFENDKANLQDWLKQAESLLMYPGFGDTYSNIKVPVVIDRLIDLKQLQNERQSRIPQFQQVERAMSLSQRLGIHDQATASDLQQQLDSRWKQLNKNLRVHKDDLQQLLVQQVDVQTIVLEIDRRLKEARKTLREEKTCDIGSFSNAQSLLFQFKEIKLDLETIQDILKVLCRSDNLDMEEVESVLHIQRQTIQLSRDVSTQLERMEQLVEKWTEFRDAAEKLMEWLRTKQAYLEHLPEKKMGLQHDPFDHDLTLIRALHGEYTMRGTMYERVQNAGNELKRCVKYQLVKEHIAETCHTLCKERKNTQVLLIATEQLLEQRQSLWRGYHTDYRALNHFLQGKENQLTLLSQSRMLLHAHCHLRIQHLQTIIKELLDGKELLQSLHKKSADVSALSTSGTQTELNSILEAIDLRWENLNKEAISQLEKLQMVSEEWLTFESSLEELHSWMRDTHHIFQQLDFSFQDDTRLHYLEQLKDQIKTKEKDLIFWKAQEEKLKTSDTIETTTMASISSLLQDASSTLQDLKEILNRKINESKKSKTSLDAYFVNIDEISQSLNIIHELLQEDMTSEETVEQNITSLQDNARKLAVSEADLFLLKDVLQRHKNPNSVLVSRVVALLLTAQELRHHIAVKHSEVMKFLVKQQTFASKCQLLITFMQQLYNVIAVDMPCNYVTALQETRKVQAVESLMQNHYSILQSVLNEGFIMANQMKKEDQSAFLGQLCPLQEQWFALEKLLKNWSKILVHVLNLWMKYLQAQYQLHSWLNEMEENHNSLPRVFQIHEIGRNLQQIQGYLQNLPVGSDLLQQLVESTSTVVQIVDSQTADSIEMNRLMHQEKLVQLKSGLEGDEKRLKEIKESWHHLEEGLSSEETGLKELQGLLTLSLPSTFYSLQQEIEKYDKYKSTLTDVKNRLGNIHTKVDDLEQFTNVMDVLYVRNRIFGSETMCVALVRQLCIQEKRIKQNLNKYQQFADDTNIFLEWTKSMHSSIQESCQFAPETSLRKLEEEIKVEVEEKHEFYITLITMGKSVEEIFCDESISEKINQIEIAWKSVLDSLECRCEKVRKSQHSLKEMQELMQQFNNCLDGMEKELQQPVSYFTCTQPEVDRQHAIVENLQQDVQKQASTLRQIESMSESLYSDSDAYANSTEQDAARQSLFSFQLRYRDIVTAVSEKRLSVAETWSHWQELFDKCSNLERWLSEAEKLIRNPRSDASLHTKEVVHDELKNFETASLSVEEQISQLKSVNQQYRWLAREGCTDMSNNLKNRVQEVNQRWDEVYTQLCLILRRLKHTMAVWEEFESEREMQMVWLTEMDLKLTETEQYPESDLCVKLEKLKCYESSMEEPLDRLRFIDQHGLYLQQRSEPTDAVQCEESLTELHQYWNEIYNRICNYIELLQPSQSKEVVQTVDYVKELDYFTVSLEEPCDSVDSFGVTKDAVPTMIDDVQHQLHKQDTTESASSSSSPAAMVSSDLTDVESLDSQTDTELVAEVSSGKFKYELLSALEEAEDQLAAAEETFGCRTPTGPACETAFNEYSKQIAACNSSIDLLQHLNSTSLHTENQPAEATTMQSTRVQYCLKKWQDLYAMAVEKEKRVQDGMKQWKHFTIELEQLRTWIEQTEVLKSTWTDPPRDVVKLENLIQEHKEFLLTMEKQNQAVLEINIEIQKYLSLDEERAKAEMEKVKRINKRWETICHDAVGWQNLLQASLLQCSEFSEMIAELNGWLTEKESAIQDMVLTEVTPNQQAVSVLYTKYADLVQELERCEVKVAALESTCGELFVASPISGAAIEASDGIIQEAKSQLAALTLRMQSLHTTCASHIKKLSGLIAGTVDIDKSQAGTETSAATRNTNVHEDDAGAISQSRIGRCFRYFTRVARASLPIQALMLLLLGVASLLPMAEEDFNCILTNNFARSFDPMLRYPNGPPPV